MLAVIRHYQSAAEIETHGVTIVRVRMCAWPVPRRKTNRAFREFIGNPQRNIDRVYVAVNDVCAAKSSVVDPCQPLEKVFDRALSWRISKTFVMIVRADQAQPADHAFPDPADGLDVIRVGASLEVHQESLALFCGDAGGFEDGHAAGHVHRHWLGNINVATGFSRSSRMLWEKVRRRLQKHRVHFRVNDVSVPVESGKAHLLPHTKPFAN